MVPLAAGAEAEEIPLPPDPANAVEDAQEQAESKKKEAADETSAALNATSADGREQAETAQDDAERQVADVQAQVDASAATTLILIGKTANEAVQTASSAANGFVATANEIVGALLEQADDFGRWFAGGGDYTAPVAPMNAGGKVPHQSQTPDPAGTVLVWVAASTGAAFLSALLLRRLATFTILPLLSRISHSELYDNQARRTIHELVVGQPGLCLNEIVSHTGCSRNAVSYHLFVLEKEEEIVSVKDGKYRRYFTRNGKYVNGAKNVVAALRNETTLKLAQSVLEKPGSIQRDLCMLLGSTPSATCWHAKRLLDLGVIRKERVANTVRYFPGEILSKYDFSEFGLMPGVAPTPVAEPVPMPMVAATVPLARVTPAM